MDIKVGDIVHVRMVVTGEAVLGQPEVRAFSRTSPWDTRYIDKEDVVHVEPRPFKVGDVVTFGLRSDCRILAIDGDQAWLKRPDAGCFTVGLNELEHA